MFDLTSLLTIAIAFFIAAASPGPATLAVATVSMHAGRKSGLLFGAGLALGLAFGDWWRQPVLARSFRHQATRSRS